MDASDSEAQVVGDNVLQCNRAPRITSTRFGLAPSSVPVALGVMLDQGKDPICSLLHGIQCGGPETLLLPET